MVFIHKTADDLTLRAQNKRGALAISVLLLVVEACVWREVEVVGVGDVASLFSARAFVWGDVDPHDGGLGAGEPDGGAVVVKIRDPALLVCLG